MQPEPVPSPERCRGQKEEGKEKMKIEIEFTDGRWEEYKKAKEFRLRRTFWGGEKIYITDREGNEHKWPREDVRQFNVE